MEVVIGSRQLGAIVTRNCQFGAIVIGSRQSGAVMVIIRTQQLGASQSEAASLVHIVHFAQVVNIHFHLITQFALVLNE
jgi:hypothetical protein